MRRVDLSRMRAVVAVAVAAGALAAPSAHAAALRECTTVATWTFDEPLTTANVSGWVVMDTRTQCVRYAAGGGFTIDEYPSTVWMSYSGNCDAMTVTNGTTSGWMVGERVIAYATPNVFGSPGVHLVNEHPTCSGATTLRSFAHWYYVHS